MAVIGKGELVNRLAKKTGVTTSQANKALNSVLDSISDALGSGDEVRLTGFGTFRVAETKERAGRNPRTGQPIRIPAGHRVAFSASPRLAENAQRAA